VGIFDKMTQVLFKDNENGTTTYYAKGLLHKGYIITDMYTKEKIYKFHKRIFKYLVPFGIVYTILLGLSGAYVVSIVSILLISIIVHLKQKSLTKNLSIHEEKLTIKEIENIILSLFPKSFLIFMIISGLLAILISLLLPVLFDNDIQNFAGLMIILLTMGFFLLGTGWYLYQEKKKPN